MADNQFQDMSKKINELEEKIEQLRFSRRVLMSLVEKLEREKVALLNKLEKENKKLLLNNRKFAQSLLHKNRQIMELEGVLKKSSQESILS